MDDGNENKILDWANMYPNEYVVVSNNEIIIYTADKELAYACYDKTYDESGKEPVMMPPGELRKLERQ